MTEVNQIKEKSFFLDKGVKEGKDKALKTRLRTLIFSKGLNEADFYHKIGLSKQYWYEISWGLWECPIDIRVRIAKALDTDSSVIFQNQELNRLKENANNRKG